jgi:hypothetical protein
VLYFGICNSCSNKITQISPTFEKSNPVVIIFVHIIIFVNFSFSKASFLSSLFFITSVSKRNIISCQRSICSFFWILLLVFMELELNISFKLFSICIVQTHTFCNSFELQLSHFDGTFFAKLQI